MDGLLGSFKPLLTEDNYRWFVSCLVAEVAAQMEKVIHKTAFNRVRRGVSGKGLGGKKIILNNYNE